jgi:ATP-dependent Lhr-like helicase
MSLVKNDRAKSIEIRKVNGVGLNAADAPQGFVELLGVAGFADGYRGMIYRG